VFAKEGEALKGAQKNGRRVYLRKITKKWNYLVIFSINCYLAVTHGRNAWVFARLHGGLVLFRAMQGRMALNLSSDWKA